MQEEQTLLTVEAPNEKCFACAQRTTFTIMHGVRDAHVGQDRVFEVACCDACGSKRLVESVSMEELSTDYDVYYDRSRESRFLRFLRYLSGFIHSRHTFRPRFQTLLEIGCNDGAFLAALKDCGKVVGLERSESAKIAGERRGVPIVIGDVHNAQTFEAGSFDYIYLNHSFEHLPAPNGVLRSISLWLKPGGRLFIGVPNPNGLVARIFGKSWYHLCPPLHLTRSTPEGLTAM